jgi:diamine N-acetyltransferase
VTLHELDDENWRTLFDIEVMDGQRRWVRDVPWYLAWSLASARWQPVVIRARERTIGFAMWGRAHEDGSYWIGGFVIDRREQRKGYGRAALTVLIEALRSKPGCRRIKLTYLPDNQAARALSASAGFEETGEIVDGEIVARVDVVPRRPRRKA